LRGYIRIKAWNKLWFHKIERETALPTLGTRWRALPGARSGVQCCNSKMAYNYTCNAEGSTSATQIDSL
jgi:hypothetical protein